MTLLPDFLQCVALVCAVIAASAALVAVTLISENNYP